MKRTLLSLAVASAFATQAPAVLNLTITNPINEFLTLAPGASAPVYGTITGVVSDVSAVSFLPGSGYSFAVANNGTSGTLGYYVSQNTTADFTGLLGTVTAGSVPGTYTNVIGVTDSAANEFDGENLTVQVAPEPASFAALGVGAIGLIRRRRKA